MHYCPKCKVHIRGNKRCCPLCEGHLAGVPEDPAFPALKKRKFSIFLLYKVCIFIFVITEVVVMMIHVMTGYKYHLPIVIMMWAPFVLMDLLIASYYKGNVIKLISLQAYLAMAVCLFIDSLNGTLTWSLHWMIPATLLGLVLVTILLGWKLGLRLVDYMIYLAIDVILSVLQLIPVAMGINTMPYAAVISAGVMIIIAAFVVIFRPRELGNALSKYMNV